MLPIEILQYISHFLDICEFDRFSDIFRLSLDIYIKNTNINTKKLPVGNHKLMDALIKINLIRDADKFEYALDYDMPKYLRLRCDDGKLQISSEYYVTPSCINSIPKIIKNNYETNNLRFDTKCLNQVFTENHVELIKIIQNYPEKSDISVQNYNGLWKLNYKHKMAYCISKYTFLSYIMMSIPYIYVLCLNSSHIRTPWQGLVVGVVGGVLYGEIFCRMLTKILNAKLPL